LIKTRAFRVHIHQRLRHLLESYVRGTEESFVNCRTSDAAQLVFEDQIDCVAVIAFDPFTLEALSFSVFALIM
jgi:hypothetical protein